jgi:PPM family protein phosphatase
MQIKMAGLTDIGRLRKGNQDSIFFDQDARLGIVADGIGGRKGGEIASSTVVETLKSAILAKPELAEEEVAAFLRTHVDKANQRLLLKGEENELVRGLGTTLNCLYFTKKKVYIAHIGDSRTYLYSDGQLWQLTIDHNIETYVRRGWMHPQQIQKGTKQEALVRSMGLSGKCEVDLYTKACQVGEIYLTCSDGLSGMLDDAKLLDMVQKYEKAVDKLPRALVNEANLAGGRDNISVVISQIRSL